MKSDDKVTSRGLAARGAGIVLALGVATPGPAQAETARAESVSRSVLMVEHGCLMTPAPTKSPEASASASVILGTLLAGVAGDLVTSGLNAIGSAIESAAQEKGFVAEGVDSFAFYSVESRGGAEGQTWGLSPDLTDAASTSARCLILARDGGAKSPTLSGTALSETFPGLKATDATTVAKRLAEAGLTHVPAVYLEAELHRELDGMSVRPVLLRYGEPLPGAPAKETPAELVISFAVPGGADGTDLGTLFALSRISLPKVTPGDGKTAPKVFTRKDLVSYHGTVVPLRPSAGTPDDIVKARNGLETSLDAKRKELAQLVELQRLAKRKLDQTPKPPADRQTAQNAYDDATASVKQAEAMVTALDGRRQDWKATPAGSTNVKARFIVIRDANGFWLAVASAVKGQAAATGKSVTTDLTPTDKTPAWTGDLTAYVEAQADVRAAQRALDEAIAKGETSTIPGLQDAVLKAQAHANQAAVAADRPLPYAITP